MNLFNFFSMFYVSHYIASDYYICGSEERNIDLPNPPLACLHWYDV